MQFGQIKRILFIGGSDLTLPLGLWCKQRDIEFSIYTSPRHAEEQYGDDGKSLKEVMEQSGFEIRVHDDINNDPQLPGLVDDTTLGLAHGPAWIFRQPVLDIFDGRVVNFHSIPLPRFRGGAHFTWQILQGDRAGGLNIQLIDRKLDAGAVIMSENYTVPDTARRPVDYYDAIDNHARPFLHRFVERVIAVDEFVETQLNESEALFMPRLSTVDQAFIDWNWTGDEILGFIDAFDDPYPGASTFLDGQRVHLRGCDLTSSGETYHPYQSGLIVRRQKGVVYVATTTGILEVRHITSEDGSDAYSEAKLGRRLHTPPGDLDAALSFRARYSATGLKPND